MIGTVSFQGCELLKDVALITTRGLLHFIGQWAIEGCLALE